MCDQGCIWAYLACRTPPILTSTTKAKRETPLQPWPPLMWKWKLNKQQHQHRYNKKKKNHNGAHIFCLFIHKLTNSAAAIVVETKTKKKTGWISHQPVTRVECNPAIKFSRQCHSPAFDSYSRWQMGRGGAERFFFLSWIVNRASSAKEFPKSQRPGPQKK